MSQTEFGEDDKRVSHPLKGMAKLAAALKMIEGGKKLLTTLVEEVREGRLDWSNYHEVLAPENWPQQEPEVVQQVSQTLDRAAAFPVLKGEEWTRDPKFLEQAFEKKSQEFGGMMWDWGFNRMMNLFTQARRINSAKGCAVVTEEMMEQAFDGMENLDDDASHKAQWRFKEAAKSLLQTPEMTGETLKQLIAEEAKDGRTPWQALEDAGFVCTVHHHSLHNDEEHDDMGPAIRAAMRYPALKRVCDILEKKSNAYHTLKQEAARPNEIQGVNGKWIEGEKGAEK